MTDYKECLDNPFGYINTFNNWNRYTPFFMRVSSSYAPLAGVPVGSRKNSWMPYHKNYSALWAAKKWGTGYDFDYYPASGDLKIFRFILDNKTGTIAWRNYDERSGRLLLRTWRLFITL